MAVWLVAAGLHGCEAQDAWQYAPAHDDFRYAHVLHSGYQLSESVMTSASTDPARGLATEQLQEAYNEQDTQETHSGKKLAGYGTSVLSSATNSTVLNDVVDGYAGEGAYPAGPGYDIATGLGSLNVANFIEYMDTQ